jgi:hypothetical protein
MSSDTRDFNNIEIRTAIYFVLFLQGNAPEEIDKGTLEEHAPFYATVKNLVFQFIQPVMHLVLDDP